jgi:molybdopterin/thiamine biosynthesis adenylyltransferase
MSRHPTIVLHDAQLERLALGTHTATAYATDGAQVLQVFVGASIGRPTGAPVSASVLVAHEEHAELAAEELVRALSSEHREAPAVAVLVGVSPGSRTVRAWLRASRVTIPCELVRVPTRSDLFSRSRGPLETDALARRTVGIVGVGSGGSAIAVDLARAGVGRFVLIDPDGLELANLSRHVCGLSDLGRAKVAAVRDLLLDRNPHVAVAAHALDVLAEPARAREALADVDLLVGATDDPKSRGWINRLALATGRTAIFGRALTRAYGGDVLRVRPHHGPCVACVYGAGLDREEEITTAAQAENAPGYVSADDRAALVQPGLSADIAPIANMMVRLALLELSRGTNAAITTLDADLTADLYVWANRRERAYAAWSPMAFDSRTPSILRWYGASAERDQGCIECGAYETRAVELQAEPPQWG